MHDEHRQLSDSALAIAQTFKKVCAEAPGVSVKVLALHKAVHMKKQCMVNIVG